jgi:hypothetical protein
MVEIMKNFEYLNEQKKTIFNNSQWDLFKANYNLVKSQEKYKTSFATMVNNLVYKMTDSERVSNDNITDLLELAKNMLTNDKYIKLVDLVGNGFEFKIAVVEILKSTQKIGVIKTKKEDEIEQKIGLKVARGERILRDLFLSLLSDIYITKIEKKKKEEKPKAKKTTKK